jgi:hypothetical protein
MPFTTNIIPNKMHEKKENQSLAVKFIILISALIVIILIFMYLSKESIVQAPPEICPPLIDECGTLKNAPSKTSIQNKGCIYLEDQSLCNPNQICSSNFKCIDLKGTACKFSYNDCVAKANDNNPLTLPNDISNCVVHGFYTQCPSNSTGSTKIGDPICV